MRLMITIRDFDRDNVVGRPFSTSSSSALLIAFCRVSIRLDSFRLQKEVLFHKILKSKWNFHVVAYFNPTVLMLSPHNTERMLMIMWKTRTFEETHNFKIFNMLQNTAVKEFKRTTKMSCRFSLHCITTVT